MGVLFLALFSSLFDSCGGDRASWDLPANLDGERVLLGGDSPQRSWRGEVRVSAEALTRRPDADRDDVSVTLHLTHYYVDCADCLGSVGAFVESDEGGDVGEIELVAGESGDLTLSLAPLLANCERDTDCVRSFEIQAAVLDPGVTISVAPSVAATVNARFPVDEGPPPEATVELRWEE